MQVGLSAVILPTVLWAVLSGTACQRSHLQTDNKNNAENQNIVHPRTQVLEEARKQREGRIKQLNVMDVPQLAQELTVDSQKGVEPFNSLPFAEMVSRGENAAPALTSLLTRADRSSLLGLLALRKISATKYKELKPELRVNILVDALKSAKYFNTWGLPHIRWEDSAKALIEEGPTAERPLFALLTDTRDAPVWGSEDFAEYEQYKYRVCDYAWALLIASRTKKVEVPIDPAARDRLISEVLKRRPSSK